MSKEQVGVIKAGPKQSPWLSKGSLMGSEMPAGTLVVFKETEIVAYTRGVWCTCTRPRIDISRATNRSVAAGGSSPRMI